MMTLDQIQQIGGALRRHSPVKALRLLILHHVAEGQKARESMLAAEGSVRHQHRIAIMEHKNIARDFCQVLIEVDTAAWERIGEGLQAAVEGLDDSIPPEASSDSGAEP